MAGEWRTKNDKRRELEGKGRDKYGGRIRHPDSPSGSTQTAPLDPSLTASSVFLHFYC